MALTVFFAFRSTACVLGAALLLAPKLTAQQPTAAAPVNAVRGDSVTVHFSDVDLRTAVQALAPFVDHPVVFGAVSAGRVSLESPRPLARREVLGVLRTLVESQGLQLAFDSSSATYSVRPKPTAPEAPVAVRPMSSGGAQQLYVIRLSHARAADVAATVNALYGRASSLGEGMQQSRGAGQTFPQQLAATQQNGDGTGSRQAGTLSTGTTIVPDPGSNSLLVRAPAEDYALISDAVKALDVRPLQVLIEVLIAEVRRNSNFTLAVGGSVSPTAVSSKGSVDGTTVSGVSGGGPVSPSTLGDFVIRVYKHGGGVNFDASLTAAESRGEARILSRPVVIAANNETAEILVGSQRPFVQVQRSLPTDTPMRDQVVQYKDVGTRLTVKPTISADGYVVLSVTQEVNQATNEVQFDAPVISTRTLQTQLLVRDSQTVVLGGIADRQTDKTRTGIPILSSLPLIGGLFGGTQHDSAQTEFFLFITPHILRTDADADAATEKVRPSESP